MNKVNAKKAIQLAVTQGRVSFTRHAIDRMAEREINRKMVFAALQHGRINREPERSPGKAALECKLDYYEAGERFSVIVGIVDADPSLIVITVLE